jgi:hypothetical protein
MEFVCACGRSFESRRSLGCHKRYCAAASQEKSPDIICRLCGKSFSEERKLRDHTKNNVCGGAPDCQFCGRTFDTRSGARQHERKAHFQEYAAALSAGAKPDPAEVLTAQLHALAAAELEIGPHPGRLAVHLGWTIDMVKYRRGLTQYRALLDSKQDAVATILGDEPPPPSTSTCLVLLAAAPTSSPSGLGPSAPSSSSACPPCSLMGLVSPEHTLSFARDNGEVWTADSQPSQSPLPSPASGSPLTHPAAVSPAVTDADQTSPLTPLPAGFLGETNDRYDHPVYPILVGLRDGVAGQRRLRCRSDILRLVSQAIDSPMEM